MSRLHGRLTALAVKHANVCGRYADGGGLYLQVSPNGSRSWILRYRLGGRRRHLGLGPLPRVTLAEARELASAARQTLRDGRDPIEVKGSRRATAVLNAAKVMTFSACAKAYIAAQSPGWSTKSTKQWATSLATYADPIIGAVLVGDVDTGLVLKVIEPIWSAKVETASRIRGRIESILDWAKTRGYREGDNPARWAGHLDTLLPAKAKVTKVVHHAAMAYAELPSFIGELRQRLGLPARALEFMILVAARTGEGLNADWSEIDLQARLWTVPGSRMKGGREHRVPLSDAAVALLGALPSPHAGLIFPGTKPGRPLSKMQPILVLQRMGHDDVTVHGFRSAFRDWAAERTNYPDQVVEQALAHTIGSAVERAYRRGDLFERRMRLMSEWASFVGGKMQPSAEVTELRRA